ncbi:MAG TPA: hypothetical protein PLB47_09150, partial [Solirubrobacterales bacterium]|nr:hypothetical protein [Solirubrobacterales bacterium]HMY27064.1 hypothetical protein [Solirubrobacterales bacterium]HNA24059.1 hypothetical protein [Solirubrobacterales bacterium]HNC06337.1 hypothetical protein [Solirubrobacterales bacterium]HNE78215.1 hypothetical protein [Solirubrobacterales bacterium]
SSINHPMKTVSTKPGAVQIDLLRNAIAFVSTNWDEDLAAALDGREGMSKLRALASWSLQTNNYDDAIRRLWIEALAGTAPEATEEIAAAKEQAQSEYQFVLAVTKEAGQDKQLADALFLAFRGYYLSSIEDPEHWPAERAQEAVLKVLDMLDKRAR